MLKQNKIKTLMISSKKFQSKSEISSSVKNDCFINVEIDNQLKLFNTLNNEMTFLTVTFHPKLFLIKFNDFL